MAEPTVVFNASTGSDTEASGAGPATAVYGAAAAHTSGAASTTITLTNSPDLSGVATDGSAVLWLKTTSGRQFSKITGKDDVADTVTVEDSFNIALASAVNYAIGGKRATWNNADSRTIFGANGMKGGWTIETETDQSITTSNITFAATSTAATGFMTIKGSGATRPVINTTVGGFSHFNCTAVQQLIVSFLKFTSTGGVKNNAAIGLSGGRQIMLNCIFGDSTDKLNSSVARSGDTPHCRLINCDINNCTSTGFNGGSMISYAYGCVFRNNSTHGLAHSGAFALVVEHCLIYGNASDGINLTGAVGTRHIANNVIHGNTGDGIDSSAAASATECLNVFNNTITANGGYGWNTAASAAGFFADYNNYGTGATANTSGAINNYSLAANDVQLDPQYVDAANGNFEIGTNLKAKGFPKSTEVIGLSSQTNSFVDIGAAQREEAGGGVRQVNIRGGADQ